jgi:DNA transformation protein
MSEFIESLHDVFNQFGIINTRLMFGGCGIYHKSLMFGLVADEALYLKTDESTIHLFNNLGLEPFCYERTGKVIRLSYYLAPDDIFDDPEAATLWAERAYKAAIRAKR